MAGKAWRALHLLVAALFIFSSAAAVAGGGYMCQATLLRNSEYQDALLKGIRDARKSIIFSFYLFKMTNGSGNLPRRVAEELVKARKRGVDVTVILEKSRKREDPLNRENLHTAAFLDRGGVRVFFDSPNTVTHSKAAVIDGRYVYLGSHNLTQSALTHNNELSVVLDCPAMAAEVRAYLDRL